MDSSEDSALEQIARRREELSAAERSVADLILTLPELPLTMSMRALAHRADVSDATVLRFCRVVGFKGYSDFRLAIARSTRSGRVEKVDDGPLPPAPSRALATAKRFLEHAEAVVSANGLGDVDKIAAYVAKADIVYVFAFGASTVAAWDFVHQLHYLGLKGSVLNDPHLQALRIAGMTESSVAIFLSIGYSRLLSEMAEAAGERGAFTVGIATPGTPLSSTCRCMVSMTKDVGGASGPPRQGRYLQLLILDTIAEQIAEFLGEKRYNEEDIERGMHFNY